MSRIEKTYRQVIDAFLELMVSQPYGRISVDSISRAAGISRVTFYKYFADKEDLLWKCFEHVYLDVSQQVERVDPVTLLSDGKPLTYYVFENIRQNRDFYENLFLGDMPYDFQCRLLDHISRESFRTHELIRSHYAGEVDYVRINEFLAGALFNLIRTLLRDGDWDSLEMAEFFTALVAPGLMQMCNPGK
ncbi:MAG: AcrR family transcriptional regulator [Spirochaetaceae bacterium]|nr:AcrR family transcriptional regulator [Spirochaetaceae bacterium]